MGISRSYFKVIQNKHINMSTTYDIYHTGKGGGETLGSIEDEQNDKMWVMKSNMIIKEHPPQTSTSAKC